MAQTFSKESGGTSPSSLEKKVLRKGVVWVLKRGGHASLLGENVRREMKGKAKVEGRKKKGFKFSDSSMPKICGKQPVPCKN